MKEKNLCQYEVAANGRQFSYTQARTQHAGRAAGRREKPPPARLPDIRRLLFNFLQINS